MKKRFFSIILAGIMTTSCFEYVATPKHTIYAQNDAVPTINYGEGNGNAATVKWDVPINETSIFMKEDFEDVGLDYSIGLEDKVTQSSNGVYYDSYGNIRAADDPVKNSLKIIPNVGYNGSKGAIAKKTAPRGGWTYNWRSYLEQPNGYSDWSHFRFKKYVPLKADKPAIVRFRAKGEGEFRVELFGDYSGNAYPSNDVTWAEDLSPEELMKRLESGIRIKINNPKGKVYTDLGITTAPCYTYDCNFYYCRGTSDKEGEQWYFTPRYWHGALGGSGRPNQSVAGSNRANVGTKNGQSINVIHNLQNAYVQTGVSTDNWKYYSMNIKIPNTKENIDTGCYFRLMNNFRTTAELAVDDITIAYAPLSRVYRNGVLVNEDYTTEYTDTAAKDTKAPNTPSSFKGTINNGKLDLSWQDSTDNGTSYTYTISSVDENGTESSKSQPKVVNVTTGVDHYEIYEGDTLKAKTTSTDYTVSSYENANNISICAVDKAGNQSVKETLEQVTNPSIEKQQQEQEAMDAVDLAEETFDEDDYNHAKELVDNLDDGEVKEELLERLDMLHEMMEEANIIGELTEIKEKLSNEDISEDEFEKEVDHFQVVKEKGKNVTDPFSKRQINKLVTEIETIIAEKKHHLTEKTFQLRVQPNAESNSMLLDWSTDINLVDYDYRIFASQDGQAFQSMPAKDEINVLEVYPKRQNLQAWVNDYDELGKINCNAVSIENFNNDPEIAKDYDVIVLGFADSNGKKDLTEESAKVLKQCIQTGKGVLFGHDTLSSYYPRPNLCSLAEFVNMKTTGGPAYKVESNAKIVQQGGLVNYPYKVGNIDDVLELPASHASYQVPNGTVWVRYSGTNQFYLTTWNNCAMIQVGHNSNITNETEQKLLLNTIYYLAQITDETTRNEYMGQDIGRPTTPELSNIQTEMPDSVFHFTLNSQDTGTQYDYYVEAVCRKHKDAIQSNTASATAFSDIKGYSIVIDENENTVPDDIIETEENTFSQNVDFTKPFYLHVKAIDNAGNCSDVMHYYYTDTKAPTNPDLVQEGDTLKLIAGKDYGFGIDKHVYRVNSSEWMDWSQDFNLLDLEDGFYNFEIKAIDKAGLESECVCISIQITYHQDRVNALVEQFEMLKVKLQDYSISQEEYEVIMYELSMLEEDASKVEDIEDALSTEIMEIEQILADREMVAEEGASRAVQYVRLSEKYGKESYITKANMYLEEVIASQFKKELIERLKLVEEDNDL